MKPRQCGAFGFGAQCSLFLTHAVAEGGRFVLLQWLCCGWLKYDAVTQCRYNFFFYGLLLDGYVSNSEEYIPLVVVKTEGFVQLDILHVIFMEPQ